jgi:hypothetical protein
MDYHWSCSLNDSGEKPDSLSARPKELQELSQYKEF